MEAPEFHELSISYQPAEMIRGSGFLEGGITGAKHEQDHSSGEYVDLRPHVLKQIDFRRHVPGCAQFLSENSRLVLSFELCGESEVSNLQKELSVQQ